ncbi:YbaB/EbfC family nucleoid-associated protein [Sulfurimonas paralvinellae]|uniref:Nucleoid-associated protein FM071_01185 n=1 Tax=Sulfurimonas paralvinellae TaxID=317658 RepID=A0A7M1B5R1_9BACT|nr:YbaB/EbfC family nucleoid-associated protein [Sulfurimonas paralvinellae]QOP44985.1 YbaB/EbfC family nucleoid-associated protein [Sulfurimonas paralvinellae]
MFENMGDLGKMLQGFEANAQKLKDELANKTFSVKSGGGMVELTLNGNGEVIDLNIDDELLEDKESLQILLIGAINDANKMVQQNQQQSALGMLGGMGGVK